MCGTATGELQLSCCKCGNLMTPVRLHVVGYFSRHLQVKNPSQTQRSKKCVKPKFYGESLTADEVFVRIQEAETAKLKTLEEKEQRKKERAEKARLKKLKTKQLKKSVAENLASDEPVQCDHENDVEEKEQENMERQTEPEEVEELEEEAELGTVAHSENTDDSDDECEVCGISYKTDSDKGRKGWIGCDGPGCNRWFHYWCVGYKRKPSAKSLFLCYACTPTRP